MFKWIANNFHINSHNKCILCLCCACTYPEKEKYLKFHIKYFPSSNMLTKIFFTEFYLRFYPKQKPINFSNDFEEFSHQPRNWSQLCKIAFQSSFNLRHQFNFKSPPFCSFLFFSLRWYSWNLSLSTENLCPNYVKPIVFFWRYVEGSLFFSTAKDAIKRNKSRRFFYFLSHHKNGEDDSPWKYFLNPWV